MIIAAQKAFNIVQTVETLRIKLYIFPFNSSKPATPTYDLTKTSFVAGVPELLYIDISEYIRPFFIQTFNHDVDPDEYLNVIVDVNGTEESHTAIDGFIDSVDPNYMYNTSVNQWKNIKYTDDDYYIGFKDAGVTKITQVYSDGTLSQDTITPSSQGYQYFRVIPKVTSTMKLTINGSNSFSYYFNLDCGYNVLDKIAFVNQYGVWEWLSFMGRSYETINTSRESYLNYATMTTDNYNVDSTFEMKYNTGWLPEDSKNMIYGLMNSLDIYNTTTLEKLTLKDTQKQIKTLRGDKMINYEFTFEVAQSLKGTPPPTT